ncbi:TRAP transporter substrate-binding protein [Candidatus Palauibacter polyketidifaciens]|uniref:TRAP transporter substrate-binding protein n=1 Tax=Candidatus Palauibacter polyketidifaciens TaxID=3056740 RepID=UPI00238C77BD|nr:TRAP transporter substrate-binding protein [Candidatus Palauibacter polyketidifaciens]MDE2720506.1 TRAP transporter substrate-binding protein [Candidatus Palauibacter polyketidifaciens]
MSHSFATERGGGTAPCRGRDRRERVAWVPPGLLPAVAAALLTGACGNPGSGESGPSADARMWEVRFSHVLSTGSEFHLMAERFRDLTFERTDGRFRVVIYPSGQLGGERVAFEQIQVGAVHMAITGTPVLSGWVPETQVFDLPFLFETRDQGLAAMNGPAGDWWRDLLLERTGVRSLGFLDYGFRHVYNRRRPVETPGDLAGLKLRVLQNATYLAAYSALGVQATPMNYGEVYSALQQGVIDGGEANAIGFVSSRLHEVAKFYSFTSITYNPITLLVNEPFYRGLPAEIRETVDRSAAEALAYQSEVARRMEAEAIEEMREAGVEISRPDPAPFAAAVSRNVRDALANGLPDGEALIARLVAEAERAASEGR